MTKKSVLFSGIQPSGNLTLGNYIGAIKNWSHLQHDYACLFSIVDLHAITVRQEPKAFREYCYDALALNIAAGLDPKKNTIFLQSQVPQHSQLAWILNCFTYMGELSRMTQFKDKSKKHASNINIGLYTYPVLMAADILLYKTNLVPVGSDQKQHLEIARDIAIRFNNIYGNIFTVPEIYLPPLGARVMSLQDPSKKMSKSDSDLSGTVFLLDSPEVITQKLMRAVTDSGKEIYFDVQNKPGVANLLTLLSVLTGSTLEQLQKDFQGQGYSKLKNAVAVAIIETLKPIQKKYSELRQDHKTLDSILQHGAATASKQAQPVLEKVLDVMGFII